MKHATSIVLALFGLAAVAPAQFRVEGSLGRHTRVAVQVGVDRHDHGGDRDRGRSGRNDRDDRGDRDRGRYDRGRPDHRARGHFETITEQVLVPGYFREESLPARYGWIVDRCGHRVWGVVEPAGCRQVWVPPHYETRCRQVWVRC